MAGGERATSHEDAAPRHLVVQVELSWGSAVRAVVVVVAAIMAIGLVRQLRTLLVLLGLSLFLSLAIEPLVRRVRARTDWPRGAAVGVVYGGAVVFIGFLVAIVMPSAVRIAQVVAAEGGEWFSDLNQWSSANLGFPLTGADLGEGAERTGEVVARFGQRVLGVLGAGASLVFALSTIAMFTFYLSADAPRLQRSVLGLFRPAAQERIVWIWDTAIEQTGAYFYSRVLLMVVNAIGFLVTLVLVGLPVTLAVSLSFVAAFISVFIPAIGTYLGAALPIVAALALQGLGSALGVLGYAIVYQQVENYILVPGLSADTMSLHGGVAFGATLVGGALGGALGAFVALPVAALLVALVANSARSHEVVKTSAFDAASPQPEGAGT